MFVNDREVSGLYKKPFSERPFHGVSSPTTYTSVGRDQRRAYHTRLRYASRLSQPLDVFVLPTPSRPYFMPNPFMGFCFQRVPPPESCHGSSPRLSPREVRCVPRNTALLQGFMRSGGPFTAGLVLPSVRWPILS
jgi:hypothetical protein